MGLWDRGEGSNKDRKETRFINNKSTFQMALREGMGFAYACEVSGNDPKELSITMLEDVKFYEECLKLVLGANLDRLTAASALTEKKEWEKAEQARRDARKVRHLNYWESKGKLEEKTEDDVFELYCELNGDYNEMAIAFGVTSKELKEYLNQHIELREMIKLMRKQWNSGLDTEGRKVL